MTHRPPAAVVCCAPTRCHDRVEMPDGGWACRTVLEAGRLSEDARSAPGEPRSGPETAPAAMDSALASRTRHLSASSASPIQAARVTAIEAGRCPCCEESLGSSEWPSWRRCVDCGCHWKIARIGGRNYAERFVNPRCEALTAAGVAGRRTA